MISVPEKIITWQMLQPTTCHPETGETIPGTLELVEIPAPELKAGEVLVEVAGCGVTNEDLSFFYDGVPTASKPPLTLGHEISGRVIAGEASWIDKEVLIPARMPCGTCDFCRTKQGHRCLDQKMPGNSMGIHGGFSSHIPVQSKDLCEIKNRKTLPLEHLAVVANAVTTAFQAAKQASLDAGDNVIVVGVGTVGQFIVQVAKALGAKTVIAVDIDEARLQRMLHHGAEVVINTTGKNPAEVAADLKRIRDEKELPAFGWKIFDATESRSGRQTALNLLGDTGKLILVGFASAKDEDALSKPMALNAEIIDTRGCFPEYYPQVLEMVTSGKIAIGPFVQTRPMSWIRKVFEAAHQSPPDRRIILTPDDFGLDDSPEPKSCR